MKALESMRVPYYVIVDQDQYEQYRSVIPERNILVQPEKYSKEYDTFWKDGDPRTGPGPARNFAWEHSISQGYDWHWVMDDNIQIFCRLNNNIKIPVASGTILKCMEDFTLRYENVAISGPNYFMFANAAVEYPAFSINTRIYSCLFIRNDIPYRWRGRYNEDTDLCLRALKDDWCTIQFNAFLQLKTPTQQMKGGNTESFYGKEGTYNKSKMLAEMHPDVAKQTWKFGRDHHVVDYSGFKKNIPRLKEGISIPKGIDNYGMKLVKIK